MDFQYALKNLIENGTNIEQFDNGYVIQINKDIKVFEVEKKTPKKFSQIQQNKLLLQARGGGMKTEGLSYAKPKKKEDWMSFVQNHAFSNQGAITVRLVCAD
ncbi:MAG: hypothetical protein EZS28_038684 [Streblomastix strix]|uniref:Uncharacterized protein n=1 Tax=Streblomastix strix TaxID=222440 RepID=A0A5J4U601_9EUKA|nr:MAG: hypothetical protein EZS28_038684 [Streblomastix strix]